MSYTRKTMKSIKDYAKATNKPIYKCGYCSLQRELHGIEPMAYTSGVYGWNSDIYIFNSFIVCTGYRPFGEKISLETLKNMVANENK